MNEAYEDVATIFPPEKSPEGKAVLLKFQTRSGKVLRLHYARPRYRAALRDQREALKRNG